ncbi:unnamed protein product [Rotaria sp. Silwood1]|nr:unnamed protein product [Rotaria sp. Silwood1]CAF1666205.1 unnamed protein product [Rotaria sp. Silwood1]
MDLELTLAMENGEYKSQQRRNSRNNNLRKQTVVNLAKELSPYLITEATTEPANQFSNNHLACSCESIVPHNIDDNNDHNIDIDFDLVENESDESDTDDMIYNQANDDLTSFHKNCLTEPDQNSALLHQYTHVTQNEFCTNLLHLLRQANISKYIQQRS